MPCAMQGVTSDHLPGLPDAPCTRVAQPARAAPMESLLGGVGCARGCAAVPPAAPLLHAHRDCYFVHTLPAPLASVARIPWRRLALRRAAQTAPNLLATCISLPIPSINSSFHPLPSCNPPVIVFLSFGTSVHPLFPPRPLQPPTSAVR